MGTRSKGPHRKDWGRRELQYTYRSRVHGIVDKGANQPESKLSRRVRRQHTRGRDFKKFLRYSFAKKYVEIGIFGRREKTQAVHMKRAKRLR